MSSEWQVLWIRKILWRHFRIASLFSCFSYFESMHKTSTGFMWWKHSHESACYSRLCLMFLRWDKANRISCPEPHHFQWCGLRSIPFFFVYVRKECPFSETTKNLTNQMTGLQYHHCLVPSSQRVREKGSPGTRMGSWLPNIYHFAPTTFWTVNPKNSLQKSPSFQVTRPSHFRKETRGKLNNNDVLSL